MLSRPVMGESKPKYQSFGSLTTCWMYFLCRESKCIISSMTSAVDYTLGTGDKGMPHASSVAKHEVHSTSCIHKFHISS